MCEILLSTITSRKRLRHSHIFPDSCSISRNQIERFLVQAAGDFITILTQPPSTTTPSLEAGDLAKNELIALAIKSKQIESIPEPTLIPTAPVPRLQSPILPQHIAPQVTAPRVPILKPQSQSQAVPPRVQEITTNQQPPVPISFLQQHSNKLTNARFNNHSYCHTSPIIFSITF